MCCGKVSCGSTGGTCGGFAVSSRCCQFPIICRPKCFSKAGRKIHVGDCALFKLTDGSPPFVGIIRRLIVGKEENLSLSVNWFYRPADVKLGEGALLGAAPNEVFYSFHKDEIPAASLLHPCKVAFLRKGVDLPSGISSFVCRRVYDIENKCLWWLTDQNYISQQEEIEQLLDKTQTEMHGVVQRGGQSPKPLNAPNGTTQLNPNADDIQNDSVSSPVKSKKREHGIHSPDSVNHACLSKADAGQHKPEQVLKSEIAEFTDKGGLMDFEGVEKLINLMQPESAEKKVALPSRVMLVEVISVTDRFDCLGRFVHLKGLLILDEWLQEVHKGKIGDGSPKGSDKSVEEFLFALLRALDRLPVNLHALQTCNIGKSVNHLRSHKNSEIQKKARSLVDMWKKRVEAEMNMIETRSGTKRGGSWPNKAVMSEVSLMGSRRVRGSSDGDAKISTLQPSALKSHLGKPNCGETIVKSPESPAFTKLASPASAGTGSSDMSLLSIKEEKSSSCSPSANNGLCCSSEHGKMGASCREDAPSSTSGSMSLNKISCGDSHSRKSGNVIHGSAVPSGQKEGVLGKNGPVNKTFTSGQGSLSRATPERVADGSSVDNMNNHRLIVRLPNTRRSVGHTASEMSRSDVSPVGSSENKSSLPEDTCSGNDTKLRQSIEDGCQSEENFKLTGGSKKHVELPASYMSVDSKGTSFGNEKTSECNAQLDSCVVGLPQNGQAALMVPDKSVVLVSDASASVGAVNGCKEGYEGVLQSPHDQKKISSNWSQGRHYPNLKSNSRSPSQEDKNAGFASEKPIENNAVPSDAAAVSVKVETQINDESPSWSSSKKHDDEKKLVLKQSSSSNSVLKKEVGKDSELRSYGGLGAKAEEADDKKTGNQAEQSEKPNVDSDSSVLLHDNEHANENIDNSEVHGSGGSAPSEKSPVDMQDDKPCVKPADVAEGGSSEEPSSGANVSSISTPASEVVKLDFDLNEVLPIDDGIHGDVERSYVAAHFSAVHTPYPLPSTTSLLTGNRPPSEYLLRSKAELGWKGSAATSAFRPAEPRKDIDVPITASDALVPDDHSRKHVRPLLDFDLNVGVIEDVSQNNGLDLNSCEESADGGLLSLSFGRSTISQLPPRSLLSGGRFSNSEPNPASGFDLNSGPGVEEIGGESSLSSNGMQFLSAVPSVRMSNMNIGNFSSWFPPNSTYPAIAIPPVLPGRGEQGYPVVPGAAASQRMLTPATAGTSFNPEVYRGPVLSSSPAVAFQFPGFPFETNFSISPNTFSAASTAYVGSSGGPLCFPTIPVGPSGVVSLPYRPFMMGLPGDSNNVGPDGRRWASQGLDLNAGPGATDLDRRDETLPTALRQLPLAGSQAMADEQLKVFQQMAAGGRGLLKRKEPDDGWDADRISYKPSRN